MPGQEPDGMDSREIRQKPGGAEGLLSPALQLDPRTWLYSWYESGHLDSQCPVRAGRAAETAGTKVPQRAVRCRLDRVLSASCLG